MTRIMRQNLVGLDRKGVPIYGPSPTAASTFLLNDTTERTLAMPVIEGKAPFNFLVTAHGNAVFFTIDQNNQSNSIIAPTSEGAESMQMLIYGSRSVDIPREWNGPPGPLYIHFASVSDDTCFLNIEFRH